MIKSYIFKCFDFKTSPRLYGQGGTLWTKPLQSKLIYISLNLNNFYWEKMRIDAFNNSKFFIGGGM